LERSGQSRAPTRHRRRHARDRSIAQATIDRALIISDADEILAADLPERLRQLQQRGWVEQRDSDAGADEFE
jgi:hypothetical protein